ncbi:MAG: hypothetical protein EBS66_17460 [Betaproteobacteria bacterium]|nr:hypothetical protein [Betaproteobacteria bacterium]
MEFQIYALVALCIHLAHFKGFVADDFDNFKRVYIAVAKMVSKPLVVFAMAVAMITGPKLAAAL